MSIDASSSTVVLEPEVMVDDIVVGRAVREAIRGLDALDISAIFSRRASVMRFRRPEPVVWDADFDPGLPRHGWQRIAIIPVHGELVEGFVRPRLSQSEQALFRSQGGPLSSVPPRASAGVAVSLMSLATTVQLARRQGCWAVEGMLLKALQPVFAARQEPVSPQTWCGIWICCH